MDPTLDARLSRGCTLGTTLEAQKPRVSKSLDREKTHSQAIDLPALQNSNRIGNLPQHLPREDGMLQAQSRRLVPSIAGRWKQAVQGQWRQCGAAGAAALLLLLSRALSDDAAPSAVAASFPSSPLPLFSRRPDHDHDQPLPAHITWPPSQALARRSRPNTRSSSDVTCRRAESPKSIPTSNPVRPATAALRHKQTRAMPSEVAPHSQSFSAVLRSHSVT
ncbi:hypothetical protein PSPO01_01373 [Paraphaeosphaeria sporulosa]